MRSSPAADRNKDIIFQKLSALMPQNAKVLEIASGSGQHAVYCSEKRPDISWQPSDIDPVALQSIAAWTEKSELSNVKKPLTVDCLDPETWPEEKFTTVVAVNMIHISPWQASLGLLQLADRALEKGGKLFVYGPFFREGIITAESNQAFDESLRAENPEWGLRQLDVFISAASLQGFSELMTEDVPANNLVCALKKH